MTQYNLRGNLPPPRAMRSQMFVGVKEEMRYLPVDKRCDHKEYKTSSFGHNNKSRGKIRTIMARKGIYLTNRYTCEKGEYSQTRINQMDEINIGDTFHMPIYKRMSGKPDQVFVGKVLSNYTRITKQEFRNRHSDILTELNDPIDWDKVPEGTIVQFKVDWRLKDLNGKYYDELTKLTKNGGRCSKQHGTFIRLD